jgi:hypothetical protein
MSKVSGMKEKLHMPIYDAFFVQENESFHQAMERIDPRVLRFFVDVQNKTRLETNQQAAGVLPSLNSYEARALRVVVSSVPEFEAIDENDNVTFTNPDDADFLADLIYNSVTSLLVGEKVMIEIPTFWFPAGAGVSPGNGNVTNHGEPDPMATFRFAEPVFIESQQNFRVETSFPRDVPAQIRETRGPLHIWIVLDGYLTRDVQ